LPTDRLRQLSEVSISVVIEVNVLEARESGDVDEEEEEDSEGDQPVDEKKMAEIGDEAAHGEHQEEYVTNEGEDVDVDGISEALSKRKRGGADDE
jgi:hypothetical protein